MGLADRDYARPSRSELSGRSRPGIGRLRMLSVNTWIIIINVLVFVVGHYAFVQYDRGQRRLQPVLWRTSAGTIHASDTSAEQKKRGVVDRTRLEQIPETPSYFGHRIYDPLLPAIDATSSRPLVTPEGKPIPKQIGWERYSDASPLDAVGQFSTGKAFIEFQVWRFITFQFLHADPSHLLFNMLGLWFIGGLVEQYLGRSRYLAFYLTSGLFGAVGYLILNLLGYLVLQRAPELRGSLPALLFDDPYTPLIGASAGVFGVLMAAAYIAPSAMVDVMFVIPMKLRTAVYIFLAIAVVNLVRGGHNAGGDAAHVGGAIAGAFFIRRPHLLRDFFDIFSDSRKARRTVDEATAVDRILDKIRESGLESLSPREREILKQESAAARERYTD